MKVSRRWWLEKAVVPLSIVLVSGLVGTLAIPQILYLRDQKHAADAFRVALIQETAEESAGLANATWQHEDALDAAFRDTYEKQTAYLRDRVRTACGHKLSFPLPPPVLKVSRDGWVHDAVEAYHSRFRNHQIWAIRSKVRARFLFTDGDAIETKIAKLENAIGEWNAVLVTRRDAYDAELKARAERIQLALDKHRSGEVGHTALHDLPDLAASADVVINKQTGQNFATADQAQQELFAALRESPMKMPMASLMRPAE